MVAARHLTASNLRAAWWAVRALRQVHRQLPVAGLEGTRVDPPPPLPASARRGVVGVIRRTKPTCLERSAVLQAWDAAHGRHRDLVIGVTAPSKGFHAHAWLDGERSCCHDEFTEFLRLQPHA